MGKFVGVFVLMIIIPSVATERASAEFVFTHFNTDNGQGINSTPYIFLLGLLMSQYTLTGYDASAHMVYLFYLFLFSEFVVLNFFLEISFSNKLNTPFTRPLNSCPQEQSCTVGLMTYM